MKDYYGEIDRVLESYELGRYTRNNLSWCADRISWCWQFGKITEIQKDNLCERVTRLFEDGCM